MRVGFAGLGIMGSRMAANLARAGHDLTVWNRTRAKAEDFAAEHRAAVADTPAALANDAEVVISMVVDGPQVEALLLGDEGVAAGAAEGLLCVDMSTIAPADARRIGESLQTRQIRFMDAPVTGSSPKAQDGTLTIMAGGDAADYEKAKPLFDVMGEVVLHVGPTGDGQTIKVINNAVAAVNAVVVAQALLVARQAGVDLDSLEAVMNAGSGGSTMLELKAGPMREHDFSPLFKLEHMLKDVRLALDAAREAGAPFPQAEEAERILAEAERNGLGEQDFAALLTVLEDASNTKL
ncbi:MAG: 3-hydroxyisobutyrate dehydrogenase [Solirubrobacteraceae bacterium]|jgi:3-hydroxyisobutyrate dehydrogenase-like beta-hydroxyacid dehydrogenase|nr:3-hydroxyisobutyrate dehydrogenase [Solirubrobacteraceae bacterium]